MRTCGRAHTSMSVHACNPCPVQDTAHAWCMQAMCACPSRLPSSVLSLPLSLPPCMHALRHCHCKHAVPTLLPLALPPCMHACMHDCTSTSSHACMHACMHGCPPTSMGSGGFGRDGVMSFARMRSLARFAACCVSAYASHLDVDSANCTCPDMEVRAGAAGW